MTGLHNNIVKSHNELTVGLNFQFKQVNLKYYIRIK